MLADAQTQSRAAIRAADAVVGLAKRLEDAAQLLLAHADALVVDAGDEAGAGAVRRGRFQVQAHGHAAGGGKLDGIAEQVAEDLRDARAVRAHALRHAVADLAGKVQLLPVGLRTVQGQHVIEQQARVEVAQFDVHLACLDLGQVEDVVQDAHQVLHAIADTLRILLL